MSITQSNLAPSSQSPDRNQSVRQIDSAAWAVFFMWVGVVMLAGVPWGWFLVGVGILFLGAQMMRRMWNLKVEAFGVAVGLIILAGGVWELLSMPWPFMPIILILLGAYLFWKALSPTPAQ